MTQNFSEILAVGGKTNSLGRSEEVIETVLNNKARLNELYKCLFNEDAWVRMRAIDSLEKICRVQPDWVVPYIDNINKELTNSSQPSIQWHIAQLYGQLRLTTSQRKFAISWLKKVLSSTEVDWIVAANAMAVLVKFSFNGWVPKSEVKPLLERQLKHHSKSVVKRANKLLNELQA